MSISVGASRRAQDAVLRSRGIEARAREVDLARLGIRGRMFEVGVGPPVVLLHGGGGTGADRAPLLSRLEGFRRIVPDRPGFGLTDLVDYEDVDLRAHACDFVRDDLDIAAVARASFVANSTGALWTWPAAM